MREYAQIVNDIVKNVAVFEDEPMFEPAEGFFIEVTKTIPRPGIGWTYLGGDRFEPPEYKPPENIEVLVGQYRVQICKSVFTEARAWVKQNNRVRTQHHETGGLLWGLWDDAIGLIWIFDASGPPPDSSHDPGHFLCGVEGTVEEHEKRMKQSFGTNGFVGFWHTHPNMASGQSMNDIFEMTELVAHFGQNQKRSVMMIFGRTAKKPTVGIYI